MRTVYILGAGASHAAWGFPLLKTFLRECDSQLERSGEHVEFGSYLKRFGGIEHANIEDVLDDLDETLLGLGSIWHGGHDHPRRISALRMRSLLVRVIRERLLGTSKSDADEHAMKQYRAVLGPFDSGDAVVTFNYDLGVEVFARTNGPVQKAVGSAESVLSGDTYPWISEDDDDAGAIEEAPFLLKLHGSASYYVCGNAGCPKRYRIMIRNGATPPVLPCSMCGADVEPVIVAPSSVKRFAHWPRLSLLWRIAHEKLGRAERLIVWGFSCPPSDRDAAWLLRSACVCGNLREVHIIDPAGEAVKKRLGALLPSGVRFKCAKEADEYEAPRGGDRGDAQVA